MFKAIGPQAIEYDNGKPTIELFYGKFLVPMNTYVASNFLAARAATRHASTPFRLILFITSHSIGIPHASAIGAAMGAHEMAISFSLTRNSILPKRFGLVVLPLLFCAYTEETDLSWGIAFAPINKALTAIANGVDDVLVVVCFDAASD